MSFMTKKTHLGYLFAYYDTMPTDVHCEPGDQSMCRYICRGLRVSSCVPRHGRTECITCFTWFNTWSVLAQ